MTLQSILYPKSKGSLEQAKKWIVKNGYLLHYKNKAIDITDKYYRFRQAQPLSKKKIAMGWYYFIKNEKGIKFIIMAPPK